MLKQGRCVRNVSPFFALFVLLGLSLQPKQLAAGGAPKDYSRDYIKRTDRPENYETPLEVFSSIYTPADRFFVRSHLPIVPEIDVKDWRLEVSGEGVSKPFVLTMSQLKKEFEQVEVPALALCAGNRRAKFEPRVQGVQWDLGAMGNAKWKGVRLRDILLKAGVQEGALEVSMNGADQPVLSETPDFIKSIPIAKAMDGDTLIAYEMNGEPLPQAQGYPARVVVPGWVATYWMKQVVSLKVVKKPEESFWMKKAYRIQRGLFPQLENGFDSQKTETQVPVAEIAVNSQITNLRENQGLPGGREFTIQGLAWDGGHGIENVEVSLDGGVTWGKTQLGEDVGRFSWRQFFYRFTPKTGESYSVLSRANNKLGDAQPFKVVHNPSGYHHNAVSILQVRGEK